LSSRILVIGGGSFVNAAILSVLNGAGIADKVVIVDEANAREHFVEVTTMVQVMPEPECSIEFDSNPQRAYGGPPIKGKKGRYKRW
jgi:hypothetical protein